MGDKLNLQSGSDGFSRHDVCELDCPSEFVLIFTVLRYDLAISITLPQIDCPH